MVEGHEAGGGYYDPALHCAAAAAEERSFWARGRNALIIWALETYFPNAVSFLEVGCGTGIVLRAVQQALPGLELSGGDPFRPALEQARRRLSNVHLFEVDANNLEFEDEFDVVAALDVLEHLPDDVGALRRLERAARPGGGVLIAVPQHPWLWSGADEWALHHRRYRRGELLERVTATGLDVVRTTSFVSLLLPLLTIARFAERIRGRRYDPLADFQIPRLVEAALGGLMSLELAVIKRGTSFSMGGSLLVVARKRWTVNRRLGTPGVIPRVPTG